MRLYPFALALTLIALSAPAQADDFTDEPAAQPANHELYLSSPRPGVDTDDRIPGESRNGDELRRGPGKPCEGACN